MKDSTRWIITWVILVIILIILIDLEHYHSVDPGKPVWKSGLIDTGGRDSNVNVSQH